jgi:hypothetical protein
MRLRMHELYIPPLPQYVFIVWWLMKQEIRLYGVVLSKTQGLCRFVTRSVLKLRN